MGKPWENCGLMGFNGIYQRVDGWETRFVALLDGSPLNEEHFWGIPYGIERNPWLRIAPSVHHWRYIYIYLFIYLHMI